MPKNYLFFKRVDIYAYEIQAKSGWDDSIW